MIDHPSIINHVDTSGFLELFVNYSINDNIHSFVLHSLVYQPLRGVDTSIELGLQGIQSEIHVCSSACDDLMRLVDKASGVDEFDRIECSSADVTLIASSVL